MDGGNLETQCRIQTENEECTVKGGIAAIAILAVRYKLEETKCCTEEL